METSRAKFRGAAAVLLTAAFAVLSGAREASANPSMSADFSTMMSWLSREFVQGVAFNAGSTFDPPREVRGMRFQPDLSFGIGNLPLNKSSFPVLQTPALRDMDMSKTFPAHVLFPNLTMHMRAGLPWRSDIDLRFADMTIPAGYKVSANTTSQAQSNSFGFGLRRHLFGGDLPLLSLGANYNHVAGRILYKSKSSIDDPNFSGDTDVRGTIRWNVSSFGLNAVLSHSMGRLTPFVGFGYNYVTGSVEASLLALPQSPLVNPIIGAASQHPEQTQGRVIFGFQSNRSRVSLFSNGEIKAIGMGRWKAWIVQSGITLPFSVGASGVGYASTRVPQPEPRHAASRAAAKIQKEPYRRKVPETADVVPELIFIQ